MILISEQATLDTAAKLAGLVEAPCTIFLQGDLGAGKTTFSRGFIQALGHVGVVTSPTYALVETYQLPQFTVHHFDLYRLKSADTSELEFLHEYFTPEAICLIEWPQNCAQQLPAPDISINLEHAGEHREIKWQANKDYTEQLTALFAQTII